MEKVMVEGILEENKRDEEIWYEQNYNYIYFYSMLNNDKNTENKLME